MRAPPWILAALSTQRGWNLAGLRSTRTQPDKEGCEEWKNGAEHEKGEQRQRSTVPSGFPSSWGSFSELLVNLSHHCSVTLLPYLAFHPDERQGFLFEFLTRSFSTQTPVRYVSPSTNSQNLVEVAPFLLPVEIHFMKQWIYVPTLASPTPQLTAVLLGKSLLFVRYVIFPLQETYKIYRELLSPFQWVLFVSVSNKRLSNQHKFSNTPSAFFWACQQ